MIYELRFSDELSIIIALFIIFKRENETDD